MRGRYQQQSAPCAASVRPQTGPAMMRVRSSTLIPAAGDPPPAMVAAAHRRSDSMLEQRKPCDSAALRTDPTLRTSDRR